MTRSLAGQSAVVTGASRGIGLAVSRALAASGARVAMLARSAAALEERAAELGDGVLAIPCDVTDRADVTRAAERVVNAFGGAPTVLVNSAGVFAPEPVDQITPAEFADTITVNLIAPFLLVRTFLPEMRARGAGHIVTIGSVADRVPLPGNGAYAASKYGLRGLHEVLRAELRGTGVRATLVSPGPTDTSIWDPIDLGEPGRFPPRAAMLRPDAIADAVLYAVSRPLGVNVDELRLAST